MNNLKNKNIKKSNIESDQYLKSLYETRIQYLENEVKLYEKQ